MRIGATVAIVQSVDILKKTNVQIVDQPLVGEIVMTDAHFVDQPLVGEIATTIIVLVAAQYIVGENVNQICAPIVGPISVGEIAMTDVQLVVMIHVPVMFVSGVAMTPVLAMMLAFGAVMIPVLANRQNVVINAGKHGVVVHVIQTRPLPDL